MDQGCGNGNGSINNGSINRNTNGHNGKDDKDKGHLESENLRMNKMGLEDTQEPEPTQTLKRKRENNNPLEQFMESQSKLKKAGNKEEPIEL